MILKIKSDKGTMGLRIKSVNGDNAIEDKQRTQGNNNITNHKKFKDAHDIDKNITEIIRDNEELDNTIKKIIENGIEE